MTQIIAEYVEQLLETASQTRVMNIDEERTRITQYLNLKGILLGQPLTMEIVDELFEVFVENYIHDYQCVDNGYGFSYPMTERESLEREKERLLNIVSNYKDTRYFHDLLDALGFEYANPYELNERYELNEEQQYDVEIYTYYEMICTHKETGLELICFLGSNGEGSSYGFELTKENWLAHVESLKTCSAESVKDAKVQNHAWVECEFFDGVDDATKREVLDLASNLGIIEGRGITNEAIDHHMKNSEHLAETFKGISHSDIRCVIDYSLDCLNAKCRENGDAEIY